MKDFTKKIRKFNLGLNAKLKNGPENNSIKVLDISEDEILFQCYSLFLKNKGLKSIKEIEKDTNEFEVFLMSFLENNDFLPEYIHIPKINKDSNIFNSFSSNSKHVYKLINKQNIIYQFQN